MKKWLAIDAFRHLGAETKDSYAWSAQSPDGSITVLTLWDDEIEDDGTNVKADFFDHPKLAVWSKQKGNATRRRHLQHVWDGDRKFKVVMLRAQDPKAIPRSAAMRWPEESLTMTLLAFEPATGAFRAEGTRSSAGSAEAGSGWSSAELEACVRAYRQLWVAQQAGTSMNKSALRREVVAQALPKRGEGAYERRMQNISAVMDELGLPFVQGYLPLRNVGAAKGEIIKLINKHWERSGELEAPTADAEELETRVASASQRMAGIKASPPPGNKAVVRAASTSSQFLRDPNVIAWVRNEAAGRCEACGEPAPFVRGDGVPYLEVHHMRPLSEGGPDTVDNAIAGCPNCHRRLHHADDREQYRTTVIAKIARLIDHPKRRVV